MKRGGGKVRRKVMSVAPDVPVRIFGRSQVENALTFAGLEWGAFRQEPHFDSGILCTYLKADIQEYSAFIVALAVQCRMADIMAPLADQVQLQYDDEGDTRFWLPGIAIA